MKRVTSIIFPKNGVRISWRKMLVQEANVLSNRVFGVDDRKECSADIEEFISNSKEIVEMVIKKHERANKRNEEKYLKIIGNMQKERKSELLRLNKKWERKFKKLK